QAGIIAGLGGLAVVTLLLLAYYRSLGVVAVIGFSIFGSLLVLMFSLLGLAGLTLTLAGVTGIIVSVGITADSYIVYFERIKEEVRKGISVEEAIDDGFKRAYRTIRTADFVSIMGAFLLWVLAVGPVKGFAMALGVATILDLIIAPWFTRNAVGLIGRSGLGDGGWFSIRGAAGRAA
ncbi:MAG: MMPL family transporter, partial [Acidimicrobiia bacterium]|nr:MMPL family transporter [Acidimicrobiia bacterium]